MTGRGGFRDSPGYFDSPEWREQVRRRDALFKRIGPPPHDRPYDVDSQVIRDGDRVRLTPGLAGSEVQEGVAEKVGRRSPCNVEVDGWSSASYLWEKIRRRRR